MGEYGKCRRCGAQLLKADYRRTERQTVNEQVWVDDRLEHRTRTNAIYRHLPCPKCGDPEPLRSLRNNPQMIAFLVVFSGIWAAGLYALFLL